MRIVKSAGMDGLEFERNVVKNKKEKSWETMIEKFSRFYLYRLEFFPSISSETRNNTTIVMIFFSPWFKDRFSKLPMENTEREGRGR